jgi:hypothetical protein
VNDLDLAVLREELVDPAVGLVVPAERLALSVR